MRNPIDPDVVQYCRQCTDDQLANILYKEWMAFDYRDYDSVVKAAEERGWIVKRGRRIT